jgi:hypothetical protein
MMAGSEGRTSMGQELPPPMQMMKLFMGSWVAQAVGAAARLGVADHMANGMVTAEELAKKTNASVDGLHRLLRALASIGVFTMEGNKFGLNPLGETLRSGVPGSMRNIAIAETDLAHWLTWGRFTDAVKEGRGMAREALGMDPWDYYGKHAEDGVMFSRAMADISGIAIQPVLAGYDFSSVETIVDVGGAHGALLCAILAKNPKAKGIIIDLPPVAASAKGAIEAAGMSGRVEIVAGDFFKAVPKGADLYLLKHIIHDWDDAHAVDILKTVRAAMKPMSKVIVVEMALPRDAAPTPAHLMDLNMLVMLSGRERTNEEYAALFEKAGLKASRFIATPSPIGIVEAML